MEFILAIVLLTFWAIYIGRDSAKTKKADARIEDMKTTWDRWENRVRYTDAQEAKLREDAISPSRYGKMRQSALETIRSFHGLEYACFDTNRKKYGDEKIRTMVKYIESIKRGKLPRGYYDRVPSLDEVIDLHIPRTARIEFGRWIEKTMQEAGVTEARLYVQAMGGYTGYAWEPYKNLGNTDIVTHRQLPSIRVTDHSWEERITGGYSDELAAELNAPLIERNKARQQLYDRYKTYTD